MFTEVSEGLLIDVRAYPGAKRNEIRGIQNNALKVAVTQQPEKGKANKAIRELLIKSLKLKSSQVELINGETSTTKKFLIRDINIEEIQKRINNIKEK
jgi:uncharacterized protein (TIGR00251 family)